MPRSVRARGEGDAGLARDAVAERRAAQALDGEGAGQRRRANSLPLDQEATEPEHESLRAGARRRGITTKRRTANERLDASRRGEDRDEGGHGLDNRRRPR